MGSSLFSVTAAPADPGGERVERSSSVEPKELRRSDHNDSADLISPGQEPCIAFPISAWTYEGRNREEVFEIRGDYDRELDVMQ